MTQLSRLEWVVLNQTVKNRNHFIFATVPLTAPDIAIKKKEELLKSVSEELGKSIPKPYKIPSTIRAVSENLEFHMNNAVDAYLNCSRASKAGRTNKKATELNED